MTPETVLTMFIFKGGLDFFQLQRPIGKKKTLPVYSALTSQPQVENQKPDLLTIPFQQDINYVCMSKGSQ